MRQMIRWAGESGLHEMSVSNEDGELCSCSGFSGFPVVWECLAVSGALTVVPAQLSMISVIRC